MLYRVQLSVDAGGYLGATEEGTAMKGRLVSRAFLLPVAFTVCLGWHPETAGGAVRLKFANIHAPTQPYSLAMKKWGEGIEKETQGAVTVGTFHAGSACANQPDCFGQIKVGTIDLTISIAVKDDVPALQIVAFPYAFTSYEAWRKFVDGEHVRRLQEEFLRKTGVRILGAQYLGARHLTTGKKVVLKPEDLRGMKVRAVEFPLFMDMVRGLGALPTPIAFQEVLGALKTGVVDGQENPIPTVYQMKFYQAQKYMMLTSHLLGGDFWMMNEKRFQSLSPDVRALVLKTAREAMLWGDKLILEQEKDLMGKLTQEGMTLVGPKDGLDVEAFVRSVRSFVWPKYEADLGKEIMDAARAQK